MTKLSLMLLPVQEKNIILTHYNFSELPSKLTSKDNYDSEDISHISIASELGFAKSNFPHLFQNVDPFIEKLKLIISYALKNPTFIH